MLPFVKCVVLGCARLTRFTRGERASVLDAYLDGGTEMSVLDDALDWVTRQLNGPPPTIDDCHPFGNGGGDKVVEKKPKRSVTREEAENLLVRCEGCGVPQLFINGGCRECGTPLPDPVVPETIVKERVVREYMPNYSEPSIPISPSSFTAVCSTSSIVSFEPIRRGHI